MSLGAYDCRPSLTSPVSRTTAAYDSPVGCGVRISASPTGLDESPGRGGLDEHLGVRMADEREVRGEGPLVGQLAAADVPRRPLQSLGRRARIVQQVIDAPAEAGLVQVRLAQDSQVAGRRHMEPEQVVVVANHLDPAKELLVVPIDEQPPQLRLAEQLLGLGDGVLLVGDFVLQERFLGKAVPVRVHLPDEFQDLLDLPCAQGHLDITML